MVLILQFPRAPSIAKLRRYVETGGGLRWSISSFLEGIWRPRGEVQVLNGSNIEKCPTGQFVFLFPVFVSAIGGIFFFLHSSSYPFCVLPLLLWFLGKKTIWKKYKIIPQSTFSRAHGFKITQKTKPCFFFHFLLPGSKYFLRSPPKVTPVHTES